MYGLKYESFMGLSGSVDTLTILGKVFECIRHDLS